MEEKITPIFEIGNQVINLKISTRSLTISELSEFFYYTEEGIIIPFDRQQEWKLYGHFMTGDEILVPGVIKQSSDDTYQVVFPWANGHICRCFEDSWIVPKGDGDKLFIKQEKNG